MSRSLDGVRVLDLSRLLPGPFLTMVLADLGADVVKVEDPRVGDYLRAFPPGKGGVSGRYLAINRGKRSIALDLKSAAGRDALLAMAERADVVVESFRPGVLDKLGVGYAALSARNPKLVVCSISGYGATGPYVDKAGHDLNYIAVAGVLAMGGARGGAPAMPGVQIADLAGGALWGATAVLGALLGRARTGRGEHLDISMTEGAMALMIAELGNVDCGARPTRGVATLNGGLACYDVYRAGDGRWLAVGALEPKFWMALNAALGRAATVAELVGDAAAQERVRGELAAIFATKPAADWVALCAKHDCCVELVAEIDELAAHPLHRERGVFFEMDGGAGVGPIAQMRTPVGAPAEPVRPPPRLGEHTREVLVEYGLDAALVEQLAT
jgi:crotonobetainyl-CoA:carnitine CoA-transferase CaiB-like acyl-CoA transferase|nr:CaiB/BaiF CoA-transferase family protein [Kofleriaceae bacterium]